MLVLMLTTAGEAFWAAALRLPAGRVSLSVAGACSKVMPRALCCTPCSHSGLRVATTNHSASNTVTDWENNNQERLMLGIVPFFACCATVHWPIRPCRALLGRPERLLACATIAAPPQATKP